MKINFICYVYRNRLTFLRKEKYKPNFVRICFEPRCLEFGSVRIFDDAGNKKRWEKIFNKQQL